LKQQVKITTGTEQSKIQEQIDKITTDIVSNRKEVETLVTKREEAITEETTARTEITYISQ
jgi:chromosome segregation ATPase